MTPHNFLDMGGSRTPFPHRISLIATSQAHRNEAKQRHPNHVSGRSSIRQSMIGHGHMPRASGSMLAHLCATWDAFNFAGRANLPSALWTMHPHNLTTHINDGGQKTGRLRNGCPHPAQIMRPRSHKWSCAAKAKPRLVRMLLLSITYSHAPPSCIYALMYKLAS